MKFENSDVMGFEGAIRGMRNPMSSWSKSDSYPDKNSIGDFELGTVDADLVRRLLSTGSDSDGKFLRMIYVTVDITAPVYFCAELDTYKVSTVRDSCSLQHKGMSKDYSLEDFTFENDPNIKLSIPEDGVAYDETFTEIMNDYVNNVINQLRQKYKDTKDYAYFRALRQALPMGYNYKFTWSANYAVLRNIYRQRCNHRLSEWHEFCKWIEQLPYADLMLVSAHTLSPSYADTKTVCADKK